MYNFVFEVGFITDLFVGIQILLHNQDRCRCHMNDFLFGVVGDEGFSIDQTIKYSDLAHKWWVLSMDDIGRVWLCGGVSAD